MHGGHSVHIAQNKNRTSERWTRNSMRTDHRRLFSNMNKKATNNNSNNMHVQNGNLKKDTQYDNNVKNTMRERATNDRTQAQTNKKNTTEKDVITRSERN